MSAKFVQLLKATNGKSKYTAVFYDALRKRIRTVNFGDINYQSYPDHQDLQRKANYLSRHSNEDWTDPQKAGTLSKFLLWNRTTISASYKDYRQRFKLELY